MNTPTNDPHAESKKLYEQDALETDTPWKRWEFMSSNYQEWVGCDYEPSWYQSYAYRRITTLTINGHEVPMPLYARPEGVEVVYAPVFYRPHLYVEVRVWVGEHDEWKRGIYHLTAEAAVLHARAILSLTER